MKTTTGTRPLALAAALAAMAGLAGCTSTVSKGVDDAGVAQEIVFPPVQDTAGVRGGVFPRPEHLRRVQPGATKEDLYHLLGRPHFSEMFRAREWDYVFKFRDTEDGPVTVCQYKVLFDKDMKARSFHWKPQACAAYAGGPASPAAPRQIRLKADALFPFGKSALADMREPGRRQLDALADAWREPGHQATVRITGHTDRLGSPAYNQRLSQRRAETVRAYLASRGVAPARMVAEGRGAREPVVQCARQQHAALVRCLEPNRRVDMVLVPPQP